MSGVHLNNALGQNKMSTSIECVETPDAIFNINLIILYMENNVQKLEIAIKNEGEINPKLFSEFVENFNSLDDENVKIRIMLLVRDLAKAQKN